VSRPAGFAPLQLLGDELHHLDRRAIRIAVTSFSSGPSLLLTRRASTSKPFVFMVGTIATWSTRKR